LLEPRPAPRIVAAPAMVPQAPAASSFPWGLLMVGLALVAAIGYFLRTMNRPRLLPAGSGYASGGSPFGTPQPAGAGGVGPMPGGGIGSGILGGLATGAAVGAGMVAGEALMHRVFDGGHAGEGTHAQAPVDYPVTPEANYDMGGNDFGVADGGSWDDGGAGGGDDWN
jgi:hypothetical protein